ncbi:MAG: hypothetical protein JWQ49_6250 [Edaphobacter sp.]|nr:hypothetical protein [Edaphobacter sp.]
MFAVTIINTDRLLLRPHHMDDLVGITNFFMSPICTQYMLIPKEMQNPEGAKQGPELLIQSYVSPQPIFALTIADAVSDDFWGLCQLWPHEQPKVLRRRNRPLVTEEFSHGSVGELGLRFVTVAPIR